MKTVFYTEKFGKLLAEIPDQIIFLNIKDRFTAGEGELYQIVWKLYNSTGNIMVYHGKLIC